MERAGTGYEDLDDDGSWFPHKENERCRTQKARGVVSLWFRAPFYGFGVGHSWLESYNIRVFPTITEGVSYYRTEESELKFPVFARPCPTVPRHGFVESRIVNGTLDLLKVIGETLDADPNGEVLIMPKMSGRWSAILTHAGVYLGDGNDGATTGRATTRFIPSYVSTKDFIRCVGSGLCRDAGIKESPYLEYVEDRGNAVPVQLRDGPETPRSTNFIPKKMKVENVLRCMGTEDLLEWETKIAGLKGKTGTVIWHPGGTLTSHFAVHALVNQVPFVVDAACPQVGEELMPTEWAPPALTEQDCKTIAMMIRNRLAYGYRPGDSSEYLTDVALTAVSTLHACAQWGNEPHLLRLRAEGVASTLLLTAAACIGEDRHWYTEGPGAGFVIKKSYSTRCECAECKKMQELARKKRKGTLSMDVPRPALEVYANMDPEECAELERSSVYEKALVSNAQDLHRWVRQAADDFRKDGWGDSFGGSAWAKAADVCAHAFRVVDQFLEQPCPETWVEVMGAYNKLINACHNNGQILTKWVSRAAMDKLHLYPGIGLLNNFVAGVLQGMETIPSPGRISTVVPFTTPQKKVNPVVYIDIEATGSPIITYTPAQAA